MGVRVSLIYRRINKGEIDFPITPRQTSAIVELFEVIREEEGGRRVHGLEITTGPDAQQRIQEIAERLCVTHSLSDFECIQRLGYVPSGEALLCVRTAAGDRKQALTAADEFVQQLNEMGVVSRELRE
jgi:molybdopterin synthase catalytic subunit